MNENIDMTALAAQVAEGTAEIVEAKPVKKGLSTGNKLADAGILTGIVAATGVGAFFLGKRHERKKWQNFDADEYEEFDDFDDIDSLDEEPEDQEKPEKVDGQVEG